MKMRKLNLPIIKGGIPSPKYLSMDDYLRFVILNTGCIRGVQF